MGQEQASGDALPFPVLVGDIGGTNARFAIVTSPDKPASEPIVVQTKDFASIDDAIRAAVLPAAPAQPRSTILAVAGPVDSDEIALTNCPWVVRPRQMFGTVGLKDVVVLNDFEAQALSVVTLGDEHLETIKDGTRENGAGKVVLGPGTGLGVAGLIFTGRRWIPIPGEGGHMDIGPRTPRDFEVFPHIEKLEGRISGEQILCGRGLVNVYRAVAKASGAQARFTTPAEITTAALAATDAVAEEALSLFVTCLARTAGDLALVFMSRGGVYLTGGIAQKIVPALKTGTFRTWFEDKAPHRELMGSIPVYVMTHPLGALAGLVAYAQKPHHYGVNTSGRRWTV